jgi:FlaA1/EpsC-like NDP-sugar epimerase
VTSFGKYLTAATRQGPLHRLLVRLTGLGRYVKRTILVVSDLFVMSVAIWLAFSLRYGVWFVPPTWELSALMLAAPVIGVAALAQFGIYRVVTRFMSSNVVNQIAMAVGLSTLLWALLAFISGVQGIPRAALFIYAPFAIAGVWGGRQVTGWLLKRVGVPIHELRLNNRLPVIVYGAGQLGVQLASALERSDRYLPVSFVDRNRTLWGQYVGGYKVYRPERLAGLIDSEGVKEVMVALGHENRRDRADVIRELERLSVVVRTLPAIEDIADGRVTVNDLRAVEVDDLLGREIVPPDPELLARDTAQKNVLVTGAGGSIGSELVRQILRQNPSRLVLFDVSESALHQIESEVLVTLAARATREAAPQIIGIIGSVLDRHLVHETIETYAIETIYHAAAYKHVPIVERNVIAGLRNNTFGTLVVAEAAKKLGVARFVLISTDKAVRPSSVMGASKRLAEMILQALAGSSSTIFTMVRFGNVLDSSGSVVKLFRQQIERGGPVTVTHPEMIRYFMSIPEAATLVIQAGAMARGGEVFVLDMGEPVKIDELARSMIRLMGREVRDAANPNGDIVIEYIGLRPGEKLREELLIGDTTAGTEHPRIQTSREPFLTNDALDVVLTRLDKAMETRDVDAVTDVIHRSVEGFQPQKLTSDESGILDPLASPSIGSRTIH